MNSITKITTSVLLLAATLSSCNLYKKFEMPTDQSVIASEYAKACAGETDTISFGTTPWREVFTEPALVNLIERALENNTNLKNAKSNIEIAQAQLQGAKLAYLPGLSLAPSIAGEKVGGSTMSWSYQVPLQVSWEVDIFGRLLNGKRKAQAALLQSEDYRQAVQSQLIGAVARCFYTISNLESQVNLLKETANNWKEYVAIMREFKNAGRVNESAVVHSNANYLGALAAIPEAEAQLHEANNTMSLLLNVLPQKWDVPADANLTLPEGLATEIAISKLANRPDVKAAEQQVAVAFYAENQARANFYPGLNITADGGFTNLIGGAVKNPVTWFVNLAGSLVAPIFSRGVNIANLKVAKQQQKQAMNNFEYAVLNASAEVSNAMTMYNKLCLRSAYLAEQTENYAKAVEYTTDLLRYDDSTSYIEVLLAREYLLGAQLSVLACSLSKSESAVNLYQALGGGK